MNDKEIADLKSELMSHWWTEEFHLGLQELEERDAIKIVESLDEEDINFRVNARRFQEDYIADYLEYLWEISPESFWKHVGATFDKEAGVLWSDNLFYFEVLCDEIIPSDILEKIVNYIGYYSGENKYDLELLGCIIKSQVENNNRLTEIKNFISSLPKKEAFIAKKRISKMISDKCNYRYL